MVNGDDQGAAADVQDYAKQGTGAVVFKRSYSITFATGSATPLPEGEQVLAQLKDSLAITGLKIKVDGYTDNTGSAGATVLNGWTLSSSTAWGAACVELETFTMTPAYYIAQITPSGYFSRMSRVVSK